MELVVQAPDGHGPELYQWLIEDPDVSAIARIAAANATIGEMGVGYDLLTIGLPNVISVGQLIVAIVAYRTSRAQGTGSAPTISIRNGNTFVLIEGDGSDALRKLVQEQEVR